MKKPKYKYSEDIFPEDNINLYNPFYMEERETLPNQNSSNVFYESRNPYKVNNYRSTNKNKNRTSKSYGGVKHSNLFQPRKMNSPKYLRKSANSGIYSGGSQRKDKNKINMKQDFIVNHIFNINSVNINQVYDNYTLNKINSKKNKCKIFLINKHIVELFKIENILTKSIVSHIRKTKNPLQKSEIPSENPK